MYSPLETHETRPKATPLGQVYELSFAKSSFNYNLTPVVAVLCTKTWYVNFRHKWPVTRKMFPFDDVIMMPDYVVL